MRLVEFGAGARIVEIDGGHSEVTAAWRVLTSRRVAAVEDVVAGARTVLVRFAPGAAEEVRQWITATLDSPSPGPATTDDAFGPVSHSIPVVYDGEDLDEVARWCRLSRQEVVRRHCAATYAVAFLGFSPGFGYLTGGDPSLRVPRRGSPRRRVPSGSVALADDMSAVYPAASPGGWQLVGRTDAVLFDPYRRPPALLAPGDLVRFHPVADLGPPPRGSRGNPVPNPPVAIRGSVEVVAPGPLTTIQDRGRPGWAHLGVPRAGAADPVSFVLANRAVGNPDGAPALEMTAAGPTLRFSAPGLLAVGGARGSLLIDRAPVEPGAGPVPFGAGAVVECPAFSVGVRAYLAVAGGFVIDEVLGSASRDTLSGLGPPPLAAGQILGVGDPGLPTGWSPPSVRTGVALQPTSLPGPDEAVIVEVRPGPRRDWVAGAESVLFGSSWRAGPDSDRSGLRLEGPALPWSRPEEAATEGMVPGAVQLPGGGTPIVLLANHGATGGYPSVAVVSPSDVARLAQCPPGQEVRLVPGPGW